MTQQHIEELLQRLNKKFPSVENIWLGVDKANITEPSQTTYSHVTNSLESTRLAKENGELRESNRVLHEELNRVLAEKCLYYDRLVVTQGFLDKIMRRVA